VLSHAPLVGKRLGDEMGELLGEPLTPIIGERVADELLKRLGKALSDDDGIEFSVPNGVALKFVLWEKLGPALGEVSFGAALSPCLPFSHHRDHGL
jgi:hypothetical protein